MNTTENNKLLAEFMEFKQCKGIRSESGKYFDYWAKENFSCIEEQEIQIESEWGFGLVEQDFLFAEQLKFHRDWNWLMSVVEKCFKTEGDYSLHKEIEDALIFNTDNRIEAVYNACVEFVKWYDNQIS